MATIGGVSLPDPGASPSPVLRRVFVNAIGQKLAKLTALVSLKAIVASTLDETSLFTPDQKARRTDYVLRTDHARRLFTALFDTTFPYERRMPGTDNDLLQTRNMTIPFGHITAPTLIVHGTRDGDVPLEQGENAARRIPGAQHLWMPDEDHLGFWLSPRAEEWQRVVRTFLREHAA